MFSLDDKIKVNDLLKRLPNINRRRDFMKTTIKDIARLSGVSTTTVSKIINKKDKDISQGTIDRVNNIMRERNYVPSTIARSMVTKKTKTIGIIIPDIRNPFFPELTRGAEDMAHTLGYNLMICNTDDDIKKERQYMDILKKKMVDGIIFTASSAEVAISHISKTDPPLVLVDRDIDVPNLKGRIIVNNINGGYIAVRHLIDRGCKKIAIIAGSKSSLPSVHRYEGYVKALEENGIKLDKELCRFGSFKSEYGYEMAMEILNSHNDVDGIFCASDMIAIGAMKAVIEKGLKIPADVKIVGFDDIYISAYLNPALTTVKQPIYSIGSEAAKLLIESIEDSKEKTSIVLETELVIREST